MIDITPQEARPKTRSYRNGRSAGAEADYRPRLKVLLGEGETSQAIFVEGRDAWALLRLIEAGDSGCTPIANPAPRWSHYIWKLRRAGIVIETVTEPHGGPFPGHHARYVLHSKLRAAAVCDEEVL